ncbi:MAG: DUF502 domain-containing protein [Planctomycetota bacterium]|jgi:uncharacterized membrane protein
MGILLRSFFSGLLFVVPVAATVYVLVWAFTTLDNLIMPLLPEPVPGLGVAVTIVAVTLVGFLGSFFLTGWLVRLLDRVFARMPLAKLLYGAIKDLLEAFVGEKKKFSNPVLVSLGGVEILGFVTRDELEWLGRKDSVAVYVPQSYNFAAQVLIFPREKVTSVDAEPSLVMQFIVSGGVSGVQ